MQSIDQFLPCPPLSIRVELPSDPASPIELSTIPTKPGVFAFENEAGLTLALATTANLRRQINAKLQPIDPQAGMTRRVDFRSLTRTVLACPVGSAFEADWAYLQLARKRLPLSYRGMLDRWQAWFVQCDPEAPYPQWSKTSHPAVDESKVCLGPMPDKHAAARYMDLLQDAFDLCRYHHILVQAPNATACAYKEMGRCPAPCDGSVTMESYRSQMQLAIEFGCTPIAPWRNDLEASMKQASAALDFETAQRQRQLLERTAPATRAEFARVRRLEKFAFVSVMRSERKGWARIFLVRGGWIVPRVDVPIDADSDEMEQILAAMREHRSLQSTDFCTEGTENIGMVCWHLFRPKTAKTSGDFIRFDDELDVRSLKSALRKLAKNSPASNEDEPQVMEQDMDNVAAT